MTSSVNVRSVVAALPLTEPPSRNVKCKRPTDPRCRNSSADFARPGPTSSGIAAPRVKDGPYGRRISRKRGYTPGDTEERLRFRAFLPKTAGKSWHQCCPTQSHDDFHQPESFGKTGRIGGHPAVDLPPRHESSHVRDQELRQDLRRVRCPALGCVSLGDRIIRAPRQRLAAARRDRLGFPAGWMEPGPRRHTPGCVNRQSLVVPIGRQVRLCVEKNFNDRPAVGTRERRVLRIDLLTGQNIVQAAVDALANRRGQAVE